ncbi:MAG: hypothetical protein GXO76_00590 [Calditrichaeota bacterium]|nr:hypothetical protein [Calditrichota bacterium]
MNRVKGIVTGVFLTLLITGYAMAGETIGLAPLLGLSKSASGTYNTGQKSADILQPGVLYGLSFSRTLSSHYWIEVQGFYTALYFKEEARPNIQRKQVFVVPALVFSNNLQWNVGPAGLYVPLGVGIYFWKYAIDGPGSDVVQYEGEKLEKMSPGFSTGLGLSFTLSKHFAVFADGRYHYLLCKDKFFFGEKFSEQGLFIGTTGIRFLF